MWNQCRDWGKAHTKPGMPKISSKPAEAGREALSRFSPTVCKNNRPYQHSDLRLLANATVGYAWITECPEVSAFPLTRWPWREKSCSNSHEQWPSDQWTLSVLRAQSMKRYSPATSLFIRKIQALLPWCIMYIITQAQVTRLPRMI